MSKWITDRLPTQDELRDDDRVIATVVTDRFGELSTRTDFVTGFFLRMRWNKLDWGQKCIAWMRTPNPLPCNEKATSPK